MLRLHRAPNSLSDRTVNPRVMRDYTMRRVPLFCRWPEPRSRPKQWAVSRNVSEVRRIGPAPQQREHTQIGRERVVFVTTQEAEESRLAESRSNLVKIAGRKG